MPKPTSRVLHQPDRFNAKGAEVEPLLLDERHAAALCGISFWSMRELVAAGEIPTVQFPNPIDPRRPMRRKLIDRADLLAYIQKCKGGAR